MNCLLHRYSDFFVVVVVVQENDYISSYFEDGDDFGAGSDDNMDEATY